MTPNRYALDRGELRRRLARGEVTFGTFLGAATPVTAEVCAAAGVDWVLLDLVQVAAGLGARALRATTPTEIRHALQDTRSETRPVVLVVPVIPHADLPSAGCWWDVAPAEVSESDTVRAARSQYEAGLATQRWHG